MIHFLPCRLGSAHFVEIPSNPWCLRTVACQTSTPIPQPQAHPQGRIEAVEAFQTLLLQRQLLLQLLTFHCGFLQLCSARVDDCLRYLRKFGTERIEWKRFMSCDTPNEEAWNPKKMIKLHIHQIGKYKTSHCYSLNILWCQDLSTLICAEHDQSLCLTSGASSIKTRCGTMPLAVSNSAWRGCLVLHMENAVIFTWK